MTCTGAAVLSWSMAAPSLLPPDPGGRPCDTSAGGLAGVATETVELIAAYPRVSMAPAEFRPLSADCGVILIWLREKR